MTLLKVLSNDSILLFFSRELPAADKMMYVVQPLADKSSQVMLKAPQIRLADVSIFALCVCVCVVYYVIVCMHGC